MTIAYDKRNCRYRSIGVSKKQISSASVAIGGKLRCVLPQTANYVSIDRDRRLTTLTLTAVACISYGVIVRKPTHSPTNRLEKSIAISGIQHSLTAGACISYSIIDRNPTRSPTNRLEVAIAIGHKLQMSFPITP